MGRHCALDGYWHLARGTAVKLSFASPCSALVFRTHRVASGQGQAVSHHHGVPTTIACTDVEPTTSACTDVDCVKDSVSCVPCRKPHAVAEAGAEDNRRGAATVAAMGPLCAQAPSGLRVARQGAAYESPLAAGHYGADFEPSAHAE